MKKLVSLVCLSALVLLPACSCKQTKQAPGKPAQKTMCEKKAATKSLYGKPADKKAPAKKADPKKQDTKKKYSLVNPAAKKQRVAFEEIPNLPLV